MRAPRDLRPPLPALLALRQPARSTGRSRRGSWRSPRSGTAWSSSTSRSPGCPSTSRTARSASGWRTPATGRSRRNRFWGSPIPVWKSDDPRVPAHRRLRLARRARARLRRARRPTCTGPCVDELTRPNPDDPTGRVDDAPGARGARLLVRVGLDAVRAGALPVRERATGSSTTTRATSSSSTSARPAAGSTRCTCWPRRCSTGRRSAPASRTASCSATTAARCRRACATTPTSHEVFDRDGSDAMRWFLMSSPILRGGDLVVTEQGIREGVRQVHPAAVERLVLPVALRQRRRRQRRVRRLLAHRLPARARPLRAGQDRTTWSSTLTEALDAYDIAGACASVREFLDDAHQLVHPPLAASGSGTATPTRSTPCTRCCRCCARLAAPLLPLTTEAVFRGLTGERSVHLTDWPARRRAARRRRARRGDGRGARGLLGHARRCARPRGLRVRLPLARLTVATEHAGALAPFVDLVARRGQRQGRRAHQRGRVGGWRCSGCCTSTRVRWARGSARTSRR